MREVDWEAKEGRKDEFKFIMISDHSSAPLGSGFSIGCFDYASIADGQTCKCRKVRVFDSAPNLAVCSFLKVASARIFTYNQIFASASTYHITTTCKFHPLAMA